MTENKIETYKPGVCNIGKNEIRKRYLLGVVGVVVAIVLAYIVTLFYLPKWYLLICFIPLFMGAEGFYQGYFKFCAGFAARGIFDFSGSGTEKGSVKESEAHKLDLQKATKIHIYSLVTALIITIIILFV